MYEPKTYRHWIKGEDLTSFNVVIKETDLYIRASANLEEEALNLVIKYRDTLESYIERHPPFLTSLEPLPGTGDIAPILRPMMDASRKAGVGPMASVAGAIAEYVGSRLINSAEEVIIENGGDIYLKSSRKRLIGIYAGNSPLSGKIALEIEGRDTPLGICTSSGTVGHSLSYGRADAVIVISASASLADAVATATGNMVKESGDIPKGIGFARCIDGITGTVIIKDDSMGVWGDVVISGT